MAVIGLIIVIEEFDEDFYENLFASLVGIRYLSVDFVFVFDLLESLLEFIAVVFWQFFMDLFVSLVEARY